MGVIARYILNVPRDPAKLSDSSRSSWKNWSGVFSSARAEDQPSSGTNFRVIA